MTLWRCKSYSEPESCEFFTKFTVDDPCESLNRTDQPWSKPMSQVKPVLRCPLKKGSYQIVNVEIDTVTLKKAFPGLDGYYWRVQMEVIGTSDQKIFCLKGGAEIIAMKN